MLSKADLMSEMVYEFTELQGLMGYYYAKLAKEDELVLYSIKKSNIYQMVKIQNFLQMYFLQ